MTKMMIEERVSYRGVAAAARRLKCSREHLSRVLHGTRTANPELKRKLKALGVVLKEPQ